MSILFLPSMLPAQVTISGPTCVVPGTTYQYLITGPWDSASTMQVCLTGGTFIGARGTCTGTVAPRSSILVTWGAAGSGALQLSSSKGSGSLAVTVTSPLSAGSVAKSVRTQLIAYKGSPVAIVCSSPNGGSCSPNYRYQWQQSVNLLGWTDIVGATGAQLTLAQPLLQSAFFRRKVIETGSGTIAYSDAAFVDVKAPDPVAVQPNQP
jgi:hypothetical protein